jgi:hypothetical protein
MLKLVRSIVCLGIEINQATVGKYMVRRLGPPSPTWRRFLRNHADGIAAIDMFVVPSATFRLLTSSSSMSAICGGCFRPTSNTTTVPERIYR